MAVVPDEDLLALAVALRTATRSSPDPVAQDRFSGLEQRVRASLGPSVPKLAAARALGVSLTGLDRWVDRGLIPVVPTEGSRRLRPETWPLIELLEQVLRLADEGRNGGVLATALRRLGRRPPGAGRWVVAPDLAVLPRPNRAAWELRAAVESSTPLARLENAARLSEAATALAVAGQRYRVTPVVDRPLSIWGLFEALVAGEVDFVVVGGVAVGVHGYERATKDLDVVPGPDQLNLDRLHAVLATIEAAPLELGGNSFAMTRFGRLSLMQDVEPEDYEDLATRSLVVKTRIGRLRFAGFDDLLRMKYAAGRDLDLVDIRALREARGE
jgi:hypothetical protein